MSGIRGIDLGLLRFCLSHDDGPKTPSLEQAELLKQRKPEDYEWLKTALAAVEDENDRIVRLLGLVDSGELSAEDKVLALEDVQELVENMDLANNLAKRGLGELVHAMQVREGVERSEEKAEEWKVRAVACWVLATLVQNNPFSQKEVMSQGILDVALNMLEEEKVDQVTGKILSLVSGMVRDFDEGLQRVLEHIEEKPHLFMAQIHSSTPAVRIKAMLVCTHLLNGAPERALAALKKAGRDTDVGDLYAQVRDKYGADSDADESEKEIAMRLIAAFDASMEKAHR